MLSIPVPFVVSLLFGLIAITLYIRYDEQAKLSCVFLGLCAITTAVVGLRWAYQLPFLHYLQPVLASMIPVVAWITFSNSAPSKRLYLHWIGPFVITLFVLCHLFWPAPIDLLLTAIYLFYGINLIRHSTQQSLMFNVALGSWDHVKKAENIAGWMLIFSAVIDAAMSADFAFNQGIWAAYILAIGHTILLPVLSFAVIVMGISTPIDEETKHLVPSYDEISPVKEESSLSEQDAQEIIAKLDQNMHDKQSYLDPDLTLAKLSKKIGVPAKQISIAVNQIHQRNISKLINEYRIKHAKNALTSSSDTITKVFLSSGFQTKSNFNREFLRVTGTTPSQYRKQAR